MSTRGGGSASGAGPSTARWCSMPWRACNPPHPWFIALFHLFHNHILSSIHLLFLLDSISRILHSSEFIIWFSVLQCFVTAELRHWDLFSCATYLVLIFLLTFSVSFLCSPILVLNILPVTPYRSFHMIVMVAYILHCICYLSLFYLLGAQVGF